MVYLTTGLCPRHFYHAKKSRVNNLLVLNSINPLVIQTSSKSSAQTPQKCKEAVILLTSTLLSYLLSTKQLVYELETSIL